MSENFKLDYIQKRVDTVVDRVADINKSLESVKSSFEDHVKQDAKMHVDIARVADTLTENTASLKEHMRRTELLEGYVKSVDSRFSPIELEHIRKQAVHSWMTGSLKLIAKIGAAVAASGLLIAGARKLVEYMLLPQ